MFWLIALACNGAQVSEKQPPGDCRFHDDYSLLANCVLASLEKETLKTDSSALCDLLRGKDQNECHFRFAERTDNPGQCSHAGEFETNCRLHVFSQRFPNWLDVEQPIQQIASQASTPISAVGLSPGDPRPWSAIWRAVLGAHSPLDRGRCKDLTDSMQQEACLHTAVALFHDQLTRAWSRGIDLCDGDLPSFLAPSPDPVLDHVLVERRTRDLCSPSRLPPPPGEKLPGTHVGSP